MTRRFRLKTLLLTSSSTMGLVLGGAAFAADAPEQVAQAAQAAGTGQLEEVVVTAQKRSENVQQVPIAVTAVTPATLQNIGALKSDELALAVPGLQIQHEIDATTTFIRGVGPNSNGTGEESSVAVYLDDLYIEQGDASIFSLNAISNIQVLKGPQGTLFGRNATGGVIQVQTEDPSFTPSIDAHIGYGNYDTKSGDVYVTGPIIPGILAANLAAYSNDESEGWGRDVATGERAFTSNDWAVRAKLLFTPTDTTRILVSLSHFYDRGEQGLGFNQVPQYIAAGAPGLIDGATFVGWYNTEDFMNDVSVIKHDLIEIRADQETDFAKFVDILGWQRMNGYAQFAQDGSPAALVDTRLNQKGRDWSNEFQVLNPGDAPYASWLTWIAGAYYLHDDSGYGNAFLRGAAFGFPVQT
ncbi:MAG TPA: TonB-dependent receptor plug domain-containing protein, partial [Stellaceae bacterium]|nr:TonB-dependent receptor plug domain-containing protein [Stellaceae bacterium]